MEDNTKQVIAEWIKEINEKGVNLTKWEEDFMISITQQFKDRSSISEKQMEVLERIYTDRT